MQMFKVRVRGVNTTVRSLANTNEEIFEYTRKGIFEAAKHLLDKTVAKFGSYQPTGGDPNGKGAWKKLKMNTRFRKMKKYGFSDKPLVATGETMNSFSIKYGGKGTLAASVVSTSDKLIHHVYGAPNANVPMRDPIRVTAVEELDTCTRIIEDYVDKAVRGAGL